MRDPKGRKFSTQEDDSNDKLRNMKIMKILILKD